MRCPTIPNEMTQPPGGDQPRIEDRPEQPYAGIRVAVTMAANAALQNYAGAHGIAFAAGDTPAGQAWDGRFEHYLTDPSAEPDAARWQTDVAYLIA